MFRFVKQRWLSRAIQECDVRRWCLHRLLGDPVGTGQTDARLRPHQAPQRVWWFRGEPRTEPYGTVVVFEDLYGNLFDLIEPSSSG